jgi:CheY-like chemotaxis protein
MPETVAHHARVLVVDDEALILDVVDRVLLSAGYHMSLTTSPVEALRLLESEPPFDLLLTDLVMAEMAGDELARRALIVSPQLKVLYLTGYSDRLFTLRSCLWENEAFLDKPVTVEGLREAVALAIYGTTRGSV